jgi:hypothetical protein
MWRFRGTPHYLSEQAQRLGITQVLADRARNNPEIYRSSVLLAQLCDRYHRTRKENGRPILSVAERDQIRGTLGQVELERQKLHMLAAAAEAMLAEAYEAFDFDRDPTRFAVSCDFDPPHTLPLGDGTVGVADEDLDRAIAESG